MEGRKIPVLMKVVLHVKSPSDSILCTSFLVGALLLSGSLVGHRGPQLGEILSLQRHGAISEENFGCHNWEGVIVVSKGEEAKDAAS